MYLMFDFYNNNLVNNNILPLLVIHYVDEKTAPLSMFKNLQN